MIKNDPSMIRLGYDYIQFSELGIKIPIIAPIGHLIVVGGSGSGKSTAVLYWISKLKKHAPILYIADYKRSNELSGITEHFAQFEDCIKLIREFYIEFLNTPEGGSGLKILIIDEIAGMLTHLSSNKDTKAIGDEIRAIMSSILMLGRSRKCFLWLSMQRYSASIFPSASGSADNFHICVGLGRLSVDGRKGLFAGEHFEGEEALDFKTGRGIVLIDGQPLQGIILPRLNKEDLLHRITNVNDIN